MAAAAPSAKMGLADSLKRLLYYETVKVVEIQNWKLGLLHYTIVLLILGYVVGYSIIYSKGYQGTDGLIGTTNIKVKGVAYYLNGSDLQVWDAYDVVYPPKEDSAVFLTTNVHIQRGQQRSVCSGNDNKTEGCTKDSDCTPGMETLNGIATGKCDTSTGYCYINAWCPPEDDVPASQAQRLHNVGNFTIFVRVNVDFPKFKVIRDNTGESDQENETAPIFGYNLFTPTEIVENTGYSFDDIATYGAVVAVEINWDCNFDLSAKKCNPKFNFRRIDNPHSSFSPGYNFRYTKEYLAPTDNGTFVYTRDLYKVYGLRIIFLLSGQAGKFDVVPLLINLGAGLGLLSVATIVSDVLVLYIIPKHEFYKKSKYQPVKDKSRRSRTSFIADSETTPIYDASAQGSLNPP